MRKKAATLKESLTCLTAMRGQLTHDTGQLLGIRSYRDCGDGYPRRQLAAAAHDSAVAERWGRGQGIFFSLSYPRRSSYYFLK